MPDILSRGECIHVSNIIYCRGNMCCSLKPSSIICHQMQSASNLGGEGLERSPFFSLRNECELRGQGVEALRGDASRVCDLNFERDGGLGRVRTDYHMENSVDLHSMREWNMQRESLKDRCLDGCF